MKKKVLFLVMGLCIMMLAGGCAKKGLSGELDSNSSKTTANSDKTKDTDTSSNTSSDTAATTLPKKDKYNVDDYIKLGQYKGIKVTVEKAEVTDQEVEDKVQSDLESNATEENVTGRAVKKGDIVNIDYEGIKDGKAFDGGSAKNYDLTIGAGKFIEGFEDGVIGHNVGDKFKINLTFPKDYQSKELAGQAVVFNVTVNAIKNKVVPELTEDYVKKNTTYASIDAYKTAVRKDLQASKDEDTKNKKTSDVLSAIVKNSTIKSSPQTLLDYYTAEFKNYYTQYAAAYGVSLDDFLKASNMTQDDFDKQAKSYSESMAKQELAINAIIEAEKLTLSDDEYQKGIKDLVSKYGYSSEDELKKAVSEDQLKETLLWQKTLNFVTENAVEG